MMDFASYLMIWLSLLTEKLMQVTMSKRPSSKEQKLTTMIQTEPLLARLKSLNWSSTENQKGLDSSQRSTAQVTWMPCLSLWKNLESRTLKPTLTRSPKQPWTSKTKRRWTLSKHLSVSTWTSLQARLRSLTTVQTNTLMMLPTLKAGII